MLCSSILFRTSARPPDSGSRPTGKERSDGGAQRRTRPHGRAAARGARRPRPGACSRAMREVPREAFVAAELAEFAYDDAPLPIEAGQTISQPYIVAADDRGARARGRATACSRSAPARATRPRCWPHRRRGLHDRAPRRSSPTRRRGGSASSATRTSHVRHGDGTLGWPEHAPFDAIVVAAGGPDVPPAAARAARDRRPARDPGRRRRARSSWCACGGPATARIPARGARRGALRAADRRRGLAGAGGTVVNAAPAAEPARDRSPSSSARRPSRSPTSTATPTSTRFLDRVGDARVVLHRRGDARHVRVLPHARAASRAS